MTPEEAIQEAKALHGAILASPEDAVVLIAYKLGELSGRIEQEDREDFEEHEGVCINIARSNLRSDIMQRLSTHHDADGNVWLYGQKVWWPGLVSPDRIAYGLRCAVHSAVEGDPPLVPLDQVPPAVVIPPGDTSMISFAKEMKP